MTIVRKKLDEKLFDRIDTLFASAKDALSKGENEQAARLADEAWSMLPEPKFGWDFSTVCLTWLAETKASARIGLEGLIELVEKFNASEYCAPHVFGTRFVLGTLYFERQQLDKAFELFEAANALSGGQCFSERDPRYRKFFKQRRDEVKAQARAAKRPKTTN
jgi:tetratricopeptide (TPR) repeat protein